MYRTRDRSTTRSQSPATSSLRARSRSRSTARGGGMKTHDEHGNMIDDAAITTFMTSVESLPTDEWRARTLAFESLIESLPKPNDPPPYIGHGGGITPWYKSHTALRRLFKPLSELLLDARSTVAKHTCQHLAFLVRRIKALNPANSDTCKYLLKDLLPTVLALHAQTVKVIRGYAAEMMTIIIPLCRFKSGLPVMLERLRKDKSRDVREACVKYLRLVVRHWAKDVEQPSLGSGSGSAGESEAQSQPPSKTNQDYLTPSICLHIGNGLARALMDPSQHVRMEARNAFEIFRYKYPDIWNQIVQKKDGILSKDKRLKKSIINAAIKADAEGRSDISNNYYPSYEEGEDYDVNSIHSNGSRTSWHSRESFASKASGLNSSKSRRSGSRQRPRSTPGLSGPPKRNPVSSNLQRDGKIPPSSRNGRNGSAPQAGAGASSKPKNVTRRYHSDESHNSNYSSPGHSKQYINSADHQLSPPPSTVSELEIHDPTTTNTTHTSALPEPPLMDDIIDDADHHEESRNPSSAFNPDIVPSTSSVSENSSLQNSANGGNTGGPRPNENYTVANQLLSAHKSYIDELMESLRTEMNTVREFEASLLQSKSNLSSNGGSYGPTEDEVLKYYETVYGFLERGTENGTKLREAMEKVSRTEFHH